MGKPAARVGDMTAHGGVITGPGCPTVLIGKMPAAQIGNMHTCPMVTPATPPIPHVGGPIIGPVPPTVFVGKMPAACVGDMCVCVGPPSSILPPGCLTVLIGQAGGGGGAATAGSATAAQAGNAASASAANKISGLNSLPIQIQKAIVNASRHMSQAQTQAMADAANAAQNAKKDEAQKTKKLTIADFVEILEAIEREEGYEAARFFSGVLDYTKLTMLAKSFIKGKNTDSKNDPNQMPTRFMLLYGMDDVKLKKADDHPDKFKDDHKINVANLRKGLRFLGYKVKETGPYNDEVLTAHLQYIATVIAGTFEKETKHLVCKGEDLGSIAHRYMMPSWKYLYEKNKNKIGDNPDLMPTGIELDIPQWNTTKGDEKIEAKEADAMDWTGGIMYRYPWVPYSVTIINHASAGEKQNEQKSETYSKARKYKIYNPASGKVVTEGTITKSDELEILVPDVPNKIITLDDVVFR